LFCGYSTPNLLIFLEEEKFQKVSGIKRLREYLNEKKKKKNAKILDEWNSHFKQFSSYQNF